MSLNYWVLVYLNKATILFAVRRVFITVLNVPVRSCDESMVVTTPFYVPAWNCFYILSLVNLHGHLEGPIWIHPEGSSGHFVLYGLWKLKAFLFKSRLFSLYSADTFGLTVGTTWKMLGCFHNCLFFDSVKLGNIKKNSSELVAVSGQILAE